MIIKKLKNILNLTHNSEKNLKLLVDSVIELSKKNMKPEQEYILLVKQELKVSAKLAKALVGYSNIQSLINEKLNELEEIQKKLEKYPELLDFGFDIKETHKREIKKIKKSLMRINNINSKM